MNPFGSTFAILNTTASDENEAARRRLTRKLKQLGDLEEGWSYGEGVPVSPLAIAAAEEFLFLAARLGLQADVFPNLDGGCAVAFYRENDCVEVSIHPDGRTVGIRAERGIGAEFDDIVPPRDNAQAQDAIKQVLRLVPEGEWSLRASSTYASSTEPVSGSAILFLDTRPIQLIRSLLQTAKGGSQSSKPLVPAQG